MPALCVYLLLAVAGTMASCSFEGSGDGLRAASPAEVTRPAS